MSTSAIAGARQRAIAGALLPLVLAVVLLGRDAGASASTPRDPRPYPTLPWLVAQLVPSPEIAFGAPGTGGARLGMRWQLTPILYSFGMYRKLSPWRFFVVEPLTRTSGSIETYVVPEYMDRTGDQWLVRLGLRATLPIAERGEVLSVSFGAGPWLREREVGSSWELGAYTLFGVLGLQLTISPSRKDTLYVLTLRVRYF